MSCDIYSFCNPYFLTHAPAAGRKQWIASQTALEQYGKRHMNYTAVNREIHHCIPDLGYSNQLDYNILSRSRVRDLCVGKTLGQNSLKCGINKICPCQEGYIQYISWAKWAALERRGAND